LLALPILLTLLFTKAGRIAEPSLAISWASLQLYAAIGLLINQTLFPRCPDLFTPDGRPVDCERSSSAFSKYTMNWCTAALVFAGKPVRIKDLPVLDYGRRSRSQELLLGSSPAATLWNRIIAQRYFGFVKQWILMFARSMVTFGSPYCVLRLLKSLEDSHGRTTNAWIWLFGITFFSLAQTVINHHLIWIQWSEMGIPIRAQLIMALFQKVLRKKDSKEQQKSHSNKTADKPEALNLISSDTASFSKFTAVNYIIPASFVRFIFASLFVLKLLGWQSTLVGMMVTVLSVPVHTFFINQQRSARKKLTVAQDKKTKAVSEALHNLRQIKFSALEDQWEQYIGTFRQEELQHLSWNFTATNIRSVWGIAAPFLVATASICTFACLRGEITPSIIFPLIEVLPHLQQTLGFVPVVFQDYFGARLNANRMDEYIRRPEQDQILHPSPSGQVSFQDASIAWPSDEVDGKTSSGPSQRFTLTSLNLCFPYGELSVIAGKTGSGKSLLLNAIVGEVDLLDGRIEAPSFAGGHPVAYVSQTPWLQNTTIKDNILFGSMFEEDRYKKVIQICALTPDLDSLPKGDKTEIGLRGVKLSGGQRGRLAFARALYSKTQLLVLDDIFSALDAHVSKDIFNALTGELGEGRTRILVTHHVQLCLPKTRYIVRLGDSSVEYAGVPDSIVGESEVIDAEVSLAAKSTTNENPTSSAPNKNPGSSITPKKTKKINARGDSTIYKRYFAAAGGAVFAAVYLLGLVTKQLLIALTTWLLGRINLVRPKAIANDLEKTLPSVTSGGSGLQQYLYLYLLSSLLGIVLEFYFNAHMSAGSLRASQILFREMTYKVIRMPILWLDTTSIGSLLRVFTAEVKVVDDMVFTEISNFANCVIEIATIVGVG
jgi:ABC-type multidrug transport system fused ATPase/permease subunit